jgi:hypothetical protein
METELATEPLPEHRDGTPRETALRNVMFVGCLCETVSLALLTEERELTEEPVIRAVVDQLTADEVLHARLGWVFLAETWPRLDEAARARTDAYLPVALGYLEARMLEAMPLGPPLDESMRAELHALGCLESSRGRELFVETVRSVILPRLVDHGLDAERAWTNRARRSGDLV